MDANRIDNLLNEKQRLGKELSPLLWGTLEKRESKGNTYAYLHRREDGIRTTKYIGEYSDIVAQTIVRDNVVAKDIKKKLKAIQKELDNIGYKDLELDDRIAQNVAIARRYLVDSVHKLAALEGIATTLADTERILDGGKVGDMTATDTYKIVNLKRAWEFIINKHVITSNFNLNLICEVNRFVEEGFHTLAGKIRSVPVTIGGTSYKPPLPIKSVIEEEIAGILNKKINAEDKAIMLMLYLMKRQIFIDGNKRTAVISANHLFISQGLGLIAIPAEKTDEYKKLLVGFYEANQSKVLSKTGSYTDKDEKDIIKFVKEHCVVRLGI